MFPKIVIVILILLMLASLGSAMYFMMKDRGKTDRTVTALKWRIGIWVVLLGFILAAVKLGWLEPSNSLVKKPQPTESAAPKQ